MTSKSQAWPAGIVNGLVGSTRWAVRIGVGACAEVGAATASARTIPIAPARAARPVVTRVLSFVICPASRWRHIGRASWRLAPVSGLGIGRVTDGRRAGSLISRCRAPALLPRHLRARSPSARPPSFVCTSAAYGRRCELVTRRGPHDLAADGVEQAVVHVVWLAEAVHADLRASAVATDQAAFEEPVRALAL